MGGVFSILRPLVILFLAPLLGEVTKVSAEGERSKPTSSAAEAPDPVQIRSVRTHRGYDLYLKNASPGVVTATVRVPRLLNLVCDRELPIVRELSASRTVRILSLTIEDPDRENDYDTFVTWQWGTVTPPADGNVTYRLPYSRDLGFTVSQGNNGAYSHHGLYAIDWAMPEGTEVYCAREGIVVYVFADSELGGPDPELAALGNTVWVLHADGSLGQYAHFKKDGIRVRLGQKLRPGDPIGVSGDTGYAAGPHLHFEVRKPLDGDRSTSIPIHFATRANRRTMLRRGQTYRHPQ